MFRKKKEDGIGSIDGDEGRGVRMGGRDNRPPTGYLNQEAGELDEFLLGDDDDADASERRRDPLRKR
ncbi:MAG TPA: hypothetical protein VGF69_01455 [Thermoanaerobaculia bacterium]|jgi:hypothetical protein